MIEISKICNLNEIELRENLQILYKAIFHKQYDVNHANSLSIDKIKNTILLYLCRSKVNKEYILSIEGMPRDADHKERIFLLLTNSVRPLCPNGNPKIFRDFDFGYSACMCGCSETIEYKNKIRKKIISTNLSRYGTSSSFSNTVVQQKTKVTNLARYGVENVLESKAIRKKGSKTLFERYGVLNASQSLEIRNKMSDTMMARYGSHYFSSVSFKSRNHHPKQDHFANGVLEKLNNSEYISSQIITKSTREIASDLGVNPATVVRYVNKHGINFLNKSSYENELHEYLNNMGIEVIRNSRSIIKPLELDLFLPKFNIAIEINGLYWHSDNMIEDTLYHHKKMIACNSANIRLIMINEDEYLNRKESVKRKLENICGLSKKGVGARHLKIDAVSATVANIFYEKYHIQGKSTNGLIFSLMAFYDDKPVAAMSFCKQRGTNAIELVRFCTDGKIYAGCFSKLFKAAIQKKQWNKIISFADLRYSDGGLYEKNGFTKEYITPPDYRYVLGRTTYHKSLFTKTKIRKKFNLDLNNMTECEAMHSLGYSRIYDCGKIKYVWKNTINN